MVAVQGEECGGCGAVFMPETVELDAVPTMV